LSPDVRKGSAFPTAVHLESAAAPPVADTRHSRKATKTLTEKAEPFRTPGGKAALSEEGPFGDSESGFVNSDISDLGFLQIRIPIWNLRLN
jgi:hypothetical protein